ncbi:ABC transporter ATP-binding protein [Polynucleobacter sp. AP-Capit-er-40B-B4]|uniref:ABC transporter ATP-binding protein n=1 Tax=Polynucleobacter sp. AP-Capit-er-40B-B4 TaxID=2576927 RepID=UPI001C0B98D4|nr:ATP-binding cassette domain-containing protein [Polynucleobacter sp. AP-Capit-er-40B-B4]MBU3580971.1 ABC transporter ATP-binding protein [Polynucleobacter sp. AP-Capit-er-40B-B4]
MSTVNFDNVSLKFNKPTNKKNTIKEGIIKFILNFGKNYYKYDTHDVLRDINFKIIDGDRVVIIGQNGAGKSTLLRLITGIYKPTSGEVKIEGSITSLIEVGAGMNPELTGRENIILSGLISGFNSKELRAREQEIIDFADIGDFIDVPMKYYSTGMCYRLSFSLALLVRPDILVVDELFAGGDLNFIEKSTKRVEELKNDSSIFISVTHDLNYAKTFFNKIIYIKNNKIVYFGDDIAGCLLKYQNESLH